MRYKLSEGVKVGEYLMIESQWWIIQALGKGFIVVRKSDNELRSIFYGSEIQGWKK